MMTTTARGFPMHEKTEAPADSKPMLDQVEQGYGFVPNIFKVFADSPAATQAYLSLNDVVRNKTSFTSQEQETLLLAISAHNGCGYCVAAHTGAAEGAKLDPQVIEALRANTPLPDQKLNALATFAQTVVTKQGWVDDGDIQAFLDAGYSHQHVLETIVAISMKTLSNFVNHMAETPLDDALKPKALDSAA
jgi:uncharacterized peroxidase-related enzyme